MNVDKDGCELIPIPQPVIRTCSECGYSSTGVVLATPVRALCVECLESDD